MNLRLLYCEIAHHAYHRSRIWDVFDMLNVIFCAKLVKYLLSWVYLLRMQRTHAKHSSEGLPTGAVWVWLFDNILYTHWRNIPYHIHSLKIWWYYSEYYSDFFQRRNSEDISIDSCFARRSARQAPIAIYRQRPQFHPEHPPLLPFFRLPFSTSLHFCQTWWKSKRIANRMLLCIDKIGPQIFGQVNDTFQLMVGEHQYLLRKNEIKLA